MRQSFRSLLLTMSLVAWAVQAEDAPKPAPAASLAELDQRLAEVFRTENVPGATVAIVENDAVVFTKAYGLATRSWRNWRPRSASATRGKPATRCAWPTSWSTPPASTTCASANT